MSFDTRVKDEILKIRYPRREELLAFISGVTHTACEIGISNGLWNMEIRSDFDTIMRVQSGFEYFFAGYPEIEDPLTFEEETCVVLKYVGNNVLTMLEYMQILVDGRITTGLPNFNGDSKMKSAYVAGCFVGSGKLKVPQKGRKGYLVEFSFTYEHTAEEFKKLLEEYGIELLETVRKERTILSARTVPALQDVVYLVGAEQCYWQLVEMSMKNVQTQEQNRAVNCDVANEDRSVMASVKQVLAIEKLIECGEFYDMEQNLQDIAKLRLENRNSSLEELGTLLNPPISKSGANHRMRKIVKIASEVES